MKRKSNRKLFFRLLLLVALIVAGAVISKELVSNLCEEGSFSLSSLSVVDDALIFCIFSALLVVFVPRTMICILIGVVYSEWRAVFFAIGVSSLSAVLGYLGGRVFFKASIEKYYHRIKWLHLVEEWVKLRPISLVLFVRMVLRSNFGFTNMVLGTLPLKFNPYFLSTIVGIFPATIAWVYVGQVLGCRGLSGTLEFPVEVRTKLLTVGIVLTLLGVVPLFFGSWTRKLKRR